MNEPQNSSSAGRRCPQCGAELPAGLPSDLCPKCLLKTGLATQPQTGPAGTIRVSAENLSPGLPQPGEELGHYRIVRSLGGGGMGTVFEAEDMENGRRVALKVLSQALDSPDARQRFFREGRLAASINHPNSVYVFGTEEIAGIPLITMELVTGGTLEDRVKTNGPLPPAEAVDAVLQIIAGLEAAQRIGILHRDVKPSNCFVDADGTVKIGDFGLSISTAVRPETALTVSGTFLGTPAFCSPEQLRGEELNAKSDMYSVGATLFYLLTGHTPFQAKNVVALIATVLEQQAPSPRQFRPKLPSGLAKAVRRCLEKQPGERFKNYEELRKALAPYSSNAPVPATLGLRFVAGVVDTNMTALLGLIISMAAASLKTQIPFTLVNFPDILAALSKQPQVISVGVWVVWVLYYAVPEGIWGVTLGKLLCSLRVVGLDNSPPGFWRALPRPLLYLVATSVAEILVYGFNPASSPTVSFDSTKFENLLASSDYILLALLFVTVRRRNGFAAIHDLVTKTRVVSKTSLQGRPSPAVGEIPPPAVEAKPRIGPYYVLDTIEESADTAWRLGYDLRLLRKVWIRTVLAGTPPVPAPLRKLGRIGRLRWLAGQRSSEENWDAFEAVSGQPLLRLLAADPVANPQPWGQARYWLYDLATELSAAQKDGTMPPLLALDHIWITGDGRAKILDFPALRTDVSTPAIPNNVDIPSFLRQIATAALEGRAEAALKATSEVSVPLPLHVCQFFQELPHLLDTNASLLALRPLLQRVAEVTRRRRAVMMCACIAFPFLMGCAVFAWSVFVEKWDRRNPGVLELRSFLQLRLTLQGMDKNQFPVPTDRLLAIYIASHFRAAITNSASWSNTVSHAIFSDENRRFAEESLAQHPAPTTNEMAEANVVLEECRSASFFSSDDIKDMPAFINRLRRQADPVSAFLWQGSFSQEKGVLTNYQASGSSSNLARSMVCQTLNVKIMGETNMYEEARFRGVSLRPETAWLLKQSPTNLNLANLNRHFINRLLLEDAYPLELTKTQFTLGLHPSIYTVAPPLMTMYIVLLLFVCLPALIAALAFRGGLVLLVTGVAFVRPDGTPASRARLFWRALLTWSLLLAAAALYWYSFKVSELWAGLVLGLFYCLALVSVALPRRGLQDRLAGTWPVPR